VSVRKIDFQGGGRFYDELKDGVRQYLADRPRVRRAQRRMYVKSAVILAWAVGSWALLVFWADSLWVGGLLTISLGLALAGIGFNLTHDANHGSYSPHRWLNWTMRWSLDVIGGSSYVWRVRHNIVHHTFTNISGADCDVEQLPFLRLSPEQPRCWYHRYQHLYNWPLYGALAVSWQLFGDFNQLRKGKIEGTPLPWPRGWERVGFWAGKLVFVTWAVVIPLLVRPVWQVAAGFLAASFVMAFALAVTFMLAHCVEEAQVSTVSQMDAAGPTEWARHQVATTVNFRPGVTMLGWYLGGLNYQIEHHLFARVCHVHYPALAPMVREVCARHGVEYKEHPSAWKALVSHFRWLRHLGRPAPVGAGHGLAPASTR